MEPSDASLARRWRHGDDKAAAIVVERYTDALGAMAFAILGDLSLAEEAVQETFARASKGIHRLHSLERLGAWLGGIVRHVALDIRRKRVHETRLAVPNLAAHGNPARQAACSETADRLRQAVAELPDDQRDIFAMKYVAGLSYAEIARTLGMTPAAVGQKLWRVRQKLQQELREFRHEST